MSKAKVALPHAGMFAYALRQLCCDHSVYVLNIYVVMIRRVCARLPVCDCMLPFKMHSVISKFQCDCGMAIA